MELSYLIAGAGALALIAYLVMKAMAPKEPPAYMKPIQQKKAPVVAGETSIYASAAGKAQQSSSSGKAAQAPITVWFGSQTGTAEGYAKQLAKEAIKHGFDAKAVDLEAFTPAKLEAGGLAVFVMATYGEGDPTDNAVEFTRWLKDPATPSGCLSNLQFTVFGLGNTQYEHYNAMGKLTNSRLEALGAVRVYKHGEGNDEGIMEEDWEAWKEEGLWEALRKAAGVKGEAAPPSTPTSTTAELAKPQQLPWRVVIVPAPTDKVQLASGHAMSPNEMAKLAHSADLSSRHFFAAVPANVIVNRELRQAPGVGSSTRHVEIDIQGTGLTYQTADNAFLCPENDEASVAAVAKWLGFDLNAWFTVESTTGESAPPFPTPCSVRNLLALYTDLHGAPKRDLLAQLAPFATKPAESKRLALLSSRDGKAEFQSWVTDAERSVKEVLEAFPSLALPLDAFVSILPRQNYRAYTIASSSSVNPTCVHLCASVIDTPKPGADARRRLQGVCSNQLLRLERAKAPRVLVYVRPSTFHLPPNPTLPVILIGPGTGIAPMRAFLQERRYLRTVKSQSVGPTVMFFGCRSRDEDFIYREELEGYSRDGTLSALHLAFSREQAKKVYVQHLIEQQAGHLWELIDSAQAHIYVCGATKMGHDVMKAFEKVCEVQGKKSAAASGAYLNDLKSSKRYIQELWTS